LLLYLHITYFHVCGEQFLELGKGVDVFGLLIQC